MRDFNFFEPHLTKHSVGEKRKFFAYGFVAILLILAVSYPIINWMTVNKIEDSITVMKTTIESSEDYERLAIVEEKIVRVEDMKVQYEALKVMDVEVKQKEIINDELMQEINGAIPGDLTFESMNMSVDNIVIQGNAKDKPTIAELEYNLRATGSFQDIFVPSISLTEDSYSFSISFKPKDVNNDEAN